MKNLNCTTILSQSNNDTFPMNYLITFYVNMFIHFGYLLLIGILFFLFIFIQQILEFNKIFEILII